MFFPKLNSACISEKNANFLKTQTQIGHFFMTKDFTARDGAELC